MVIQLYTKSSGTGEREDRCKCGRQRKGNRGEEGARRIGQTKVGGRVSRGMGNTQRDRREEGVARTKSARLAPRRAEGQ